jgi:hypothetical protein
LPNLSRSTRRGTGSSTSTHDEDEELVANTNHLFMHDCERNDELAENGGIFIAKFHISALAFNYNVSNSVLFLYS